MKNETIFLLVVGAICWLCAAFILITDTFDNFSLNQRVFAAVVFGLVGMKCFDERKKLKKKHKARRRRNKSSLRVTRE